MGLQAEEALALVLPPVPFCSRGDGMGPVLYDCKGMLQEGCLPGSRGMEEQRQEGGRWRKEAGWGMQSQEGKNSILRFCTRLWQLPHPTTRCHQTQNPLETRLRKKQGISI